VACEQSQPCLVSVIFDLCPAPQSCLVVHSIHLFTMRLSLLQLFSVVLRLALFENKDVSGLRDRHRCVGSMLGGEKISISARILPQFVIKATSIRSFCLPDLCSIAGFGCFVRGTKSDVRRFDVRGGSWRCR
jgi:hypothetical protein